MIDRFSLSKEIFVITNSRKNDDIILITSDHIKVVETITNGVGLEDLSNNKKLVLFELLYGISKDTTKYRTISNKRYTKYLYYNNLYNSFIQDGKNISYGTFGNLLRLKEKVEIKNLDRKLKLKQLLGNGKK